MLRFVSSILLLSLIASAGLGVAPPARPLSLAEWARTQEGRFAYGMYFKTAAGWARVGWTVEETRVGKHAGQDALIVTSESYARLARAGQVSAKGEKSKACFALVGDGLLQYAESTRTEDGQSVLRKAVRTATGLRITTQQVKKDGTLTSRDVATVRSDLKHRRQFDAWLLGHRKKGDSFERYGLSWDRRDGNSKETYHFADTRKVQHEGTVATVLLAQAVQDGGRMNVELLLPEGRLLQAEVGGLVQIRREKEAEARNLPEKLVDVMLATVVFVDRDLGRPHLVDSLKLEVSGLGEFKAPVSHRQKLTVDATTKKTMLELSRDFRTDRAAPLSKDDHKRYTRATPRIQADHAAIRKQARAIVGDEKDALGKVKKLQEWAHRKLKKSYADNADTALDVLTNLAGDCTEHTLLFVALARAEGIPAREVGGLAYVGGARPLFGWHAWAEVHDGHQWVSIDPTWGQVYVDATHVKMSAGPRDLAWVNVVGTLKLRVVEFKKKEE
jgi:hypothetical protein